MTMKVTPVRQVKLDLEDAARRDTKGLRDGFVIEHLFRRGEANLTYSHLDRMIVGGVMPEASSGDRRHRRDRHGALSRPARGRHRQHRRRGRSASWASVTNCFQEALYVGMGEGALSFASRDPAEPALFLPLERTSASDVSDGAHHPRDGEKGGRWLCGRSNARTINQYVHPDVCDSCQLLVGLTMFEPGHSVWNTMLAHLQ